MTSQTYLPRISQREKEVLNLISLGLNDKQIGKQLFLSHWTVKDHRKRIISKMACANAPSAVRRGFELGILPLQENYRTISIAS